MFKTLSNIYQKVGAFIVITMSLLAVFWGVSGGYFFYTEYVSPPKATISQERMDSYVDKLNAEEQARMKAEKNKYHK